jgi:ketosteroid isomerase-like protein
MAEHPDVRRFRRALETRDRAAIDEVESSHLADLLGDDVVWHGSSDGRPSGRDEVIPLWNAFARDGGPRISVRDVYADGLHAVAVLELGGENGQAVEQAVVFHLADGKVTELWSMPADRTIAEAFARGEPVAEHPYMPVFRIAEETRERNTFSREDVANIEAFLRDDVEWHGAGDIPGVQGRDNVIGLYKQFKEATGGTMHLGMQGTFIDDRHAASIVHLTATRADNPARTMDVMEVNLFHLDENGRAFEFWGVPADQEEMDAFWLP